MPDLDAVVTQAEFGALIGVSQQAVSDYCARGVLSAGAPLRQWIGEWARHIREQAAGRGGGDDAQVALAQARIREANAKALANEVKAARDLDALVSAVDMDKRLSAWAAYGVQSVEAAVDRIIDGIESEFRIELRDCHVRDQLRAAIGDIAAYPECSGSPVAPGGDALDAD